MMFCPYCCHPLTWEQNKRYCRSGDMYLAASLEAELAAEMAKLPGAPPLAPRATRRDGAWFCPRCRHEMTSSKRETLEQICPTCDFILTGRAVYRLVELHPHGA